MWLRSNAVRGLKTWFVACTVLAGSVAVAGNTSGGVSGGGGSVEMSSPEDVTRTVRELFDGGREIQAFAFLNTSLDRVKDPSLKAFLKKMLSSEGANVYGDLANTKYYFNAIGPCIGTDGAQQASVEENKFGSPICYSLPLLTKIPKADLKVNLMALTAHEFAHHFGADEDMAKKVEIFFRGWVSRPEFALQASVINWTAGTELEDLIKQLKAGQISAPGICARLGVINGLRSAYGRLIVAMETAQYDGQDYGLQPGTDAKSKEIEMKNWAQLRICESANTGDRPSVEEIAVNQAARKALTDSLEKEREDLGKLGDDMPGLSTVGH